MTRSSSSLGERYYVRINPQTAVVQNFYVVPKDCPVEKPHFYEITRESYNIFVKKPGAKWINSALSEYALAQPSLKLQAEDALHKAQHHANMSTAMGKVFGPLMRGYINSLLAIIDGSDKDSTQLPTPPSNPDS